MTQLQAPLADCGAPDTGRAHFLRASDGTTIRVAHWPGDRHVMILPGRTEYIEKYGLVIADLAKAGWGALAIDWRGQGLSDRLHPDPLLGHVDHFRDYQHDLDAFQAYADTVAPGPKPWLAHSMGGCIALRGLTRGKTVPTIAFSAPMLGLAQPPLQLFALRTLSTLLRPFGLDKRYAPTTGPAFGLPSMGFGDNNLTSDPDQFDRMKAQITNDPALSLGGPSLRWLAEASTEMSALATLASPQVPALFGLGSDEAIVAPQAIRDRTGNWAHSSLQDYDGAKHELTMERPDVRQDFLSRALAMFDQQTR